MTDELMRLERDINGTASENVNVVLPCSQKDFKAFLSGLLGKPQIISKRKSGSFVVDKTQILHIDAVLKQRIEQQDGAIFIQHKVVISYDDSSSVELNSLEEFAVYNEVKPVCCVSVVVSWVFMITFADKNTPEKQVVDVAFVSNIVQRVVVPDIDFIFGINRSGFVHLKIAHTARTWGCDIEAILCNAVDNMMTKESVWRESIREYSNYVSLASGAAVWGAFVYGVLSRCESFKRARESMVGEILNRSGVGGDSAKLDAILKLLISEDFYNTSAYSVWLIVGFILAVASSIMIASLCESYPKSYVLLTEKTKNEMVNAKVRRCWSVARKVGSWIVSFLIGLSSNFVFSLLGK